MNIREKLLTGAAWIVATRIVRNILAVIGMLVLARLLRPSDFGLVALGTTITTIIWMFTSVPITEALVQHPAPEQAHFHTAFTITLIRSMGLALILAASAWPLSIIYRDPRVINVMLALAISIALLGFGNPRSIMMTKKLIFWQQFMLQTSNSLTTLIVSVGIAVFYPTYWALLAGIIAGPVVNNALSYTVLPFRPRLSLAHARELMSFSVWLSLAEMTIALTGRLDQALLGAILGKTTLGYFVMGDSVAGIPTREAIAPINDTIFPAFAMMHQEPARLKAAYMKAQRMMVAISLPTGLGFAMIADPFVRAVLGAKWTPIIFIIQALAVAGALQTFGSMAHALGLATGRTSLLFRRYALFFFIQFPVSLSGMWLFGLSGYVYARAGTGIINIVFGMAIVRKLIGVSLAEQFMQNSRALVSAIFMVVVLAPLTALFAGQTDVLINVFHIGILVIFGVISYIGCSVLLWHFSSRPNGPETEVLGAISKLVSSRKSPDPTVI